MSDEPRNDENTTPAEQPDIAQDIQPKEPPRAPIIKGHEGIEGALVWISAFVIVIAGIIAYSNAFDIPFHRESKALIVNNEAMHGVLSVPNAVSPQSPRLLPLLAFGLCWDLAPTNPIPFHILAIALHLACGVLIFLLCRRLFRGALPEPIAMLAGLLFVLHPATTQAVDDIVSIPILMGTAFTLLSLTLYFRATVDSERAHWRPLVLSFAAFAAAWLSHPSAIVLPLLVLVADWTTGHSPLKRYQLHASYWGFGAAFLVTQWAVRLGAPRPIGERVTGWAQTLVPYIDLTFLWRPLSANHSFAPLGTTLAVVTAAVLLIVALGIASRRSVVGLSFLWFLAALVAGAWFAPTDEPAISEPRLYLALAGVVVIIPWVFSRIPSRGVIRPAAGVAVAVLAIVFGVMTFVRNGVWNDEVSLWNDVVAKNSPEGIVLPSEGAVTADAELYIGNLLREQGESTLRQAAALATDNMGSAAAERREAAQNFFQSAEEHMRKADGLNPEDAATLFGLGATLDSLGKRDEALDLLLRALQLDTNNAECTTRIALLLHARAASTGDVDELRRSIDYFKHAERLAPLSPASVMTYGLALAAVGDLQSADKALRRVVKEGEASPAAKALRDIRGSMARAMQFQREASQTLAKDPENADALEKMVQYLLIRKEVMQAAYLLEPLMAPERVTPMRWALMAYVKAKMGSTQVFLTEWPTPPTPEISKPSGWVLAAPMCAAEGLWDAADAYANAGAAAGDVPQPLLLLGETALQTRQIIKAQDYLQRATQAYPDSPTSWLYLSDLAFAQKDPSSAKRLLAEAEKRGASENALKPRRERLESGAKEGQESGVGTIVR